MPIAGTTSPLDYAILVAPNFDAKLVERISITRAHFEISVTNPDETKMIVQLLVDVLEDKYFKVREKVPCELPASCPQRHINLDGSFCLGWLGVMDKVIGDQNAASEWWEILYAYLRKQYRASKSRRWPGEEWAHGHLAAACQLFTEEATKNLGDDFVADLKKRNFHVQRIDSEKHSSAILKVYRNNVHIYSLWENLKRLTNSKKPCLCKRISRGKPKNIRSCGTHRQSLIDLGIYLYKKEMEENNYIKDYASLRTCCGTMDECPIKDISGVAPSGGTEQ